MGKFIYDGNIKVDFEDRLLAHLQAVIMAKVRRGESFPFTWKDDISTGGGALRSTSTRTCRWCSSSTAVELRS